MCCNWKKSSKWLLYHISKSPIGKCYYYISFFTCFAKLSPAQLREEQDEFFEVGSRIKILKVGKFWSGKNQEFLKGQEFLLSRIKNFSKLILISSKNQDIWKCHSWCQAGVGTWNSGVSLRFKQEFSNICSNWYCKIPLLWH